MSFADFIVRAYLRRESTEALMSGILQVMKSGQVLMQIGFFIPQIVSLRSLSRKTGLDVVTYDKW